MEKTVIITIGIPSCGKSTFVAEMLKDTPHVIINRDDMRKILTGREDCFTHERQVTDRCRASYTRALTDPNITHIGITNTHTSPKARKDWLVVGREFGAKFKFVLFPPDIESAMKLQNLRERQVPKEILSNMAKSWTAPTPYELAYVLNLRTDVLSVRTDEIARKLNL